MALICWNLIKKTIIACSISLIAAAAFALPNNEGIQTYRDKQSIVADIYRYHAADNIWDVLRHEFTLPHYEDSPIVQEKIAWFLSHPDYLQHSASRAAPYLYFILQQVRKRHLPVELVLLPMIESAYNPFAYSSAGAAGIWQMMKGTASGYGVRQNWWYEGRRDVVASTKAALDHLVYLGSFFEGNWLLATAAYDTGEGNVLTAIRKNSAWGRTTDYWSLPLSQETRDYVPRLLALAAIISHPEKYYITFPTTKNAPYLAEVDIGAQIDLKHAAELAGLTLKKLMHLNPGYSRLATDPSGPFKIILPIENVSQFTENLAFSPLYLRMTWIHYKIKKGDNWASIARRFSITKQDLRNVNPKLAANLKQGTNLVIPRSVPAISKTILEASHQTFIIKKPVGETLASSIKYALQPGDTLYMVRKGDTLKKIATRFHTTASVLRKVNRINIMHMVHAGEKLIVPTHHAPLEIDHQYQLSPGDTLYMVRKNDTIETIARKFNISASELRLLNLLTSNDVKEGDRLVVPTHKA